MDPRAIRDTNGWTLYDPDSGAEIGTAATAEEATRLAAAHANLREETDADRISYLGSMFEAVEATHALESAAGTTTTELDLYRRLTPEQAAARSAEDAARVAAQVEAEEVLAGGTGDIARVIPGQSRTDRQALAKGLRNTINSLYSGATVLEVFHEATHGWRREARARGRLTRADDLAILRAADAVLAGKTTRREKTQLRFLPENYDSLTAEQQETLLDEGISKLIEAEVLRTRKTGGALDLPPGLVSRNLAAFARIAQGLKDGRIDPENYQAYLNSCWGCGRPRRLRQEAVPPRASPTGRPTHREIVAARRSHARCQKSESLLIRRRARSPNRLMRYLHYFSDPCFSNRWIDCLSRISGSLKVLAH